MAPKDYTLSGESGLLFNGAQDTEGGIWVRVRDENDRRLAAAAIHKQLKNQEAAKGTLSALDPNSGHLLDYVAEALNRVLDGMNGARPASAQLDGTPMGAALSTPPDPLPSEKTKGKRGGKPSRVGDVLAQVKGGPLDKSGVASTGSGGIVWADNVPTPRPEPGQFVRTAQGHSTGVDKVIGYDGGAGAFRVIDASGWDGLVFYHGPTSEWRIMSQALDYTETTPTAAPSEPAPEFPPDALDEPTSPGATHPGSASHVDGNEATTTDERLDTLGELEPAPRTRPARKAPTVPAEKAAAQRARNTSHAGLSKPEPVKTAAKRTPAKKAPAAKTPKRK